MLERLEQWDCQLWTARAGLPGAPEKSPGHQQTDHAHDEYNGGKTEMGQFVLQAVYVFPHPLDAGDGGAHDH